MFNTGDIIVNNAGVWGHVAMCFDEEDADGVEEGVHAVRLDGGAATGRAAAGTATSIAGCSVR